MDRRVFLKLTGLVAAASALEALPVAAEPVPDGTVAGRSGEPALAAVPSDTRLAVRAPGTYRVSGVVRLHEPVVEISGITNSQSISWSDVDGAGQAVATFVTFERFDAPGMARQIQVRGGRLESVSVVPLDVE